jgi:hypothetical protein
MRGAARPFRAERRILVGHRSWQLMCDTSTTPDTRYSSQPPDRPSAPGRAVMDPSCVKTRRGWRPKAVRWRAREVACATRHTQPV